MLIGDGNGEDDNGGEDSALWKNVKTTFSASGGSSEICSRAPC